MTYIQMKFGKKACHFDLVPSSYLVLVHNIQHIVKKIFGRVLSNKIIEYSDICYFCTTIIKFVWSVHIKTFVRSVTKWCATNITSQSCSRVLSVDTFYLMRTWIFVTTTKTWSSLPFTKTSLACKMKTSVLCVFLRKADC